MAGAAQAHHQRHLMYQYHRSAARKRRKRRVAGAVCMHGMARQHENRMAAKTRKAAYGEKLKA